MMLNMKITKKQLNQIIKEELTNVVNELGNPVSFPSMGEGDLYEDEEVRSEFDPGELDLDPEAEQFAARDPEQDEQTMQDINEMYDELIVDLEDVEDPRMKAKLIKLFQGALESEGEVFNLEP
tara:strand:+ start:430 stop:798 length:369 start_codon:yes stop_codon:yes gene_type:complete